jgi:transcriptional regulator with XRE-family HTH domain
MLGKKIKSLRLELRLTQPQLAKALEVDKSIISYWENDKCEPKASYIARISKFFDVSTDYLLGLENEFGGKVDTSAPKAKIEKTKEQALFDQLHPTLRPMALGYLEGLLSQSVLMPNSATEIIKKKRG